jgi:predicted transcriptional regulator
MKLTRRQEEFVENLVDLNQEYNGPVHYSQLAERLGVSPFTSYDMLCMLEEKGVVASEYHLASDKSGPGRAERFFYQKEPNTNHRKVAADEIKKDGLSIFSIQMPRDGELCEDDITPEILPTDENNKISYCIDVLTIAALQLQGGTGASTFAAYAQEIVEPNLASREKLSLLGGFVFGILAQDRNCNEDWAHKLFEHIDQYLKIVAHLVPDECEQLANALSGEFSRINSGVIDGSRSIK